MNKHYELYKEKVEEFEKQNTLLKAVLVKNSFIKQTFIDIAEGEILRLEKQKNPYGDEPEMRERENYNETYNDATKDQISYWEEAKELIENHE